MVVLNKIYTRTGDDGETALGDGSRAPKACPRVEAYGTVDELNCFIGVARLAADNAGGAGSANAAQGSMDDGSMDQGSMDDAAINSALSRIQNDLFDLGADLCRPNMASDDQADYAPLRMTAAQIDRLEAEIDAMNAAIPPLRSFILPGGSALAAHLHVCRGVCRRAERAGVALVDAEGREAANPVALKYLNRLSDWFFVAARAANDNGAVDVLWVPGANR